MTSELFWETTQPTVVILFRCFGTTNRSRNVGKELSLHAA